MDKIIKILTELEETQKLVRIVAVDENGNTKIALGILNFYTAGDETVTIENIHTPNKKFKVAAIQTIEVMVSIWNVERCYAYIRNHTNSS